MAGKAQETQGLTTALLAVSGVLRRNEACRDFMGRSKLLSAALKKLKKVFLLRWIPQGSVGEALCGHPFVRNLFGGNGSFLRWTKKERKPRAFNFFGTWDAR